MFFRGREMNDKAVDMVRDMAGEIGNQSRSAEFAPGPTPMDTRGNVLDVRHCPVCDGMHNGLPVTAFAKQTPPWTHWFTCPTTGDPVPLTLVMMSPDRGIEINNVLIRALVHAQSTNAYMVAIFRVEDGQIKLDRTTHNFPTGDFVNCVTLLRQDLDREMGPPQQTIPLQPAVNPNPVINLFGEPKQ